MLAPRLKCNVKTITRKGRRSVIHSLIVSLYITGYIIGITQSGFAQSSIAIVDDRSVHVPEEYEVEEGDSLWLISEEFFNDPWLWPNLWALNPHITNPHWIYPGDIVRLKWSPNALANSAGLLNLQPIGYSADLQRVARLVINRGRIIENEEEYLGSLSASPESKTQLATGDRVYLELRNSDNLTLGQQLSIYRPTTEVLHPDRGTRIGQKVLLVGFAEIEAFGERFIKARIIEAQQELERGDFVMVQRPNQVEISPTKNLVDLEGVILDGLHPYSEYGQHHVIFIDLGSEDGVQVGNRLAVIRRGDGLSRLSPAIDQAMPIEPVGELMVIATEKRTSTALITRSSLELRRGDQVIMQRNY